ncbi:MAG TPA: uroporphyrinogen-III synthase [Candidatus Binatia bacterium]|nr:uroporphyrinogen-III synthase [Candidatus Binatia bacterium]
MESTARANLHGLKVVSFESRRAAEMAELIRRYGGEPITAPSMREIPLAENREAIELLPRIEAGEFDILLLLTGVGTRTLTKILQTQFAEHRILAALKNVRLVARGPKPVAALKEMGLKPAAIVPEPNTWREVLHVLDNDFDIADQRIAIQEYGIPNSDLSKELERRRAKVTSVPIYRWALPEDIQPLRDAVQKLICGEVDAALFTNGAQVDHLFAVAKQDGVEGALRGALAQVVIGSVGPVCTQALQQFGLSPDLEPTHPKMGSLIAEIAASIERIFAAKCGL